MVLIFLGVSTPLGMFLFYLVGGFDMYKDKCSICKRNIWFFQKKEYENISFAFVGLACHTNCFKQKPITLSEGGK